MMEQATPRHEMDAMKSPSSSSHRFRGAGAVNISPRIRRFRRATLLIVVVAAFVTTLWFIFFARSATSKTFTPQDRADAITAYINSITLTNRVIGYVPETSTLGENLNVNIPPTTTAPALLPAEELALQWLIEEDLASSTLPLTEFHQVRLSQRYALLTLWFQQSVQSSPKEGTVEPKQSSYTSSFLATKAKAWNNGTGWASPTVHECEWYGVACTPSEGAMLVSSIQLNLNNLRGTIPDDFGLLTSITSFRVSTNYIVGSLPKSIGQWSHLVNISLYKNCLTGSLPESTRQWSQVQSVLLHENQLNGTLPGASLGAWTQLREFNVARNQFSGSIPDAVGAAWGKTLRYAQFSVNQFTSILPPSLGQWTSLEELRISSNKITGVLPSSVSGWRSLRHAYFHDNNITGRMPLGICQSNLTTLVADCRSEVSACACCTWCF